MSRAFNKRKNQWCVFRLRGTAFFVCRLVNGWSLLKSNCTEPKVHIPEMFVRWWWQLRCILLGVFILMWRWKFPWVWVDVFIIKKYPLYWRNRTIFHNETGLLQFSALHLNHFSLCPGWCFVKYGAAWAQKIDPVEGNFVKLTSCVCLFHSAFCVAAFKVVLGVLDQCFRLVGCLPQTQHHKNAYYCKAPFNKGIKKALRYLARKYV